MDPQMLAYLSALVATVLGLLIAMIVMYKTAKPPERPAPPPQAEGAREAPPGAPPRAGLGRMRAAANDDEEIHEEDAPDMGEFDAAEADVPGGKKGQKYFKKQQMKEEQRKMREAEAAMRKKKKEEQEQELVARKEQRALEAAEQAKIDAQLAEEEEQRRKELEKKQAEEAAFWRKDMEVVAEGNAQIEAEERARSMKAMAEHVRKHKVVLLEELSSLFSMRTKDVIACLKQLETEGAISGVIDDRGKFIYIRPDELDAVARYIKKRGRVSIEELAAESNRLINLNEIPAAPPSV